MANWLSRLLRGSQSLTKQPHSFLDEAIVTLSALDKWTYRDAFNHLAVFGSPGSGKTNYILRLLIMEMMRHGFGMALFCAKPDDKHMYTDWAQQAGRLQDVLVFEPGGGHSLNLTSWVQNASKGHGVAMNIISMFEVILDLIERTGKGGGDSNPYWSRAAMECLRYAVILADLAEENISALLLYLIVTTSPSQVSNKSDTLFSQLYDWVKARELSPAEEADFRLCEQYFLGTFKDLESKTRSIVLSIVVSMLNPFIQSPLRELFDSETTITPEEVYQQRKILIINLSPAEYFELGRVGSVSIKYTLQRALLSRNPAVDGQPFALVCDEYHQFAASFDAQFQALARSNRVSVISVMQNLPLLFAALGGNHTQHQAESILGLFSTKIFAQNSCPITNEWASRLFGRKLQVFASGNVNYTPDEGFSLFGMQRMNYSGGFSETFEQVLQANEFSSLRTPGELAEAIVFASGKTFKQSGKPYLFSTFRRS